LDLLFRLREFNPEVGGFARRLSVEMMQFGRRLRHVLEDDLQDLQQTKNERIMDEV
jgi:hypothetical protein